MCLQVNPENGKAFYPIKSVGILKQHGGSAKDSTLINGYTLAGGRAAQGMPRMVKGAKIALLDIDLRKTKMAMGVSVVVTDPKKLEEIRQREADITKERIQLLLKAGANVILTTKGIDDMALKYFVEAGCIALRRVRKDDMRRIAKLTGGTMMITLADMEGNESFDASLLGVADEVSEERICDDDHLVIKGGKSQRYCSVLLRGANSHMLDEVERSLHDALCAVKRALESSSVVPGGGCVESALSIYLENFATTLGSREQLAIAEFAEALLVIPKQVARTHGAALPPQPRPPPSPAVSHPTPPCSNSCQSTRRGMRRRLWPSCARRTTRHRRTRPRQSTSVTGSTASRARSKTTCRPASSSRRSPRSR